MIDYRRKTINQEKKEFYIWLLIGISLFGYLIYCFATFQVKQDDKMVAKRKQEILFASEVLKPIQKNGIKESKAVGNKITYVANSGETYIVSQDSVAIVNNGKTREIKNINEGWEYVFIANALSKYRLGEEQ